MGVSVNYEFSRESKLDETERARLHELVTAANAADTSTAEPLEFYESSTGEHPGMFGSSKLPQEPEETEEWLLHLFASLTAVRRALPGTRWSVDLEETPVDWDDATGFSLPGLG